MYASSWPPVIISVFTVTRVARVLGGADSAMYTGTVTDASPTPNPTRTLPADRRLSALLQEVYENCFH
jgi:hypothetical protein